MGRRRGRAALAWLIGLAALAAVYGPTLAQHARRALVDGVVTDDSRVWVAPFLAVRDPALFQDDLLTDYARACLTPGYQALMQVGAALADPFRFAALLSYVLLLLFVAGLMSAAARVGGMLAALAAAAIGLGVDGFLARMAGGTPRAFGFAIAAWGVAALVRGQLRMLAVVVVAGALFYPAPALALGAALAVVALALGPRWRGEAATWTVARRLRLVALTALLALAAQLPVVLATWPYGPRLTPADVAAYPEAGVSGRFMRVDSMPFPRFAEALSFEADRLSGRHGAGPGMAALLAAAALVLAWGGRDDAAVRRLAVGAAVAIAAAQVAVWVAPWAYMPQRHIRYVLPVLAIVALLAAASVLVRRAPWPRLAVGAAVGALGAWMILGPRGDAHAGLNTEPARTPLEQYLSGLPPEVLVASWPSRADDIPWRAGRRVLVSQEHHMPFHRGYADAMRARTNALIDAYLATDAAPLDALRADFGVTHLVVDAQHFATVPPRYFAPYDTRIAARRAGVPAGGFLVPALRAQAVFDDGALFVLELRTLSPGR